jgi:hypothetical protein
MFWCALVLYSSVQVWDYNTDPLGLRGRGLSFVEGLSPMRKDKHPFVIQVLLCDKRLLAFAPQLERHQREDGKCARS